jgi:hypothetical protein
LGPTVNMKEFAKEQKELAGWKIEAERTRKLSIEAKRQQRMMLGLLDSDENSAGFNKWNGKKGSTDEDSMLIDENPEE